MRADRHRADDVAQIVDEARIVRQLELARPVRLQAIGAPDAFDRLTLSPAAFAIEAPVQWVVSPGGSPSVKAPRAPPPRRASA